MVEPLIRQRSNFFGRSCGLYGDSKIHAAFSGLSMLGYVMYPRQYTTLSLPSGLTSYFELPPHHHQAWSGFIMSYGCDGGGRFAIRSRSSFKKPQRSFKKPLLWPLTFFSRKAKFWQGKSCAFSNNVPLPLSALFPASRFKCFCMKDAPLQMISRPG